MNALQPMPTFEQLLTLLLLAEADYAVRPDQAPTLAAAMCMKAAMARLSTAVRFVA
jgi:hypothetical protein